MNWVIEDEVVAIAIKAVKEAERLISNNIINDEFIRAALVDLRVASLSNQVPKDVYERLLILGMASVRSYQSFDEIPEADDFVGLCVDISKRLSKAA